MNSLPPTLTLSQEACALEALAHQEDASYAVYILLTNTGTVFSKMAKRITKQPYNHVSVGFDSTLSKFYTYHFFTTDRPLGGFHIETPEALKGAWYSLYKLYVTPEIYSQLVLKVQELEKDHKATRYNYLGLFNAIFNKELFKSENKLKAICSEFIVNLLLEVNVQILDDRSGSRVKPYDFVRSKLLKFVRRGKFK